MTRSRDLTLALSTAILHTLTYADYFDFPLTERELYTRLIGIQAPYDDVHRVARAMSEISFVQGAYVLKGRESIVGIRRRRALASKKKWNLIMYATNALVWIPSIDLVGISGGVASSNAEEEDDIDLFIICQSGTLWITRFLVILTMEYLGIRRRPSDRQVENRICLNLFLDRETLSLPREKQDVYGAYEVCLMKPLWQRRGAYRDFLSCNTWSTDFLPQMPAVSDVRTYPVSWHLLRIFEPLSSFVQLRYMGQRKTCEIVRPGMLFFHPHDPRDMMRARGISLTLSM